MATPIPSNDARFSLATIMACTGGRLQGPIGDDAMEVRGVSTDSRTVRAGECFIALAGDKFDGHEHLDAAAARGASLAIVEREVQAPAGLTVLRVTSTLGALGQLASCHMMAWRKRDRERRVIALTGSAGKTTTKAAIVALLSAAQSGGVHFPPGNLNNLVGVPMTVLGLSDAHRYAVLELGTNQPGEIARLARMTRPDIGLLTLIDTAHSAGLGGIEAIAREKTALYQELSGVTSVAMGNADDARVLAGMMRCDAERRVSYGESEGATYRVVSRRLTSPQRARLTVACAGGALDVETPLIGRAGALATAAAVAAFEVLTGDVPDAARVGAALDQVARAGRLCAVKAPSGAWVIDDSYNANPASGRSSIETASEIANDLERRLVLVLGEMRELGGESAREHDLLGLAAASSGAALVVAVAGDAQLVAERAREQGIEAHFAEDAHAAAELALRHVRAGDVVLVKGSRGVRTELVVKALMDADGDVPNGGASPRDSCRGALR